MSKLGCRYRHVFAAAVLLGGLVLGRPAAAGTLTVAWDPSIDSTVTGYVVWVGTASNNYSRTFDVGATTTFVLPDAVAGQLYFFRVLAYAPGPVLGTPSPEVSGYSNAPPLLAMPGNQNSTVGTAASLQLSGSDPYGDPVWYGATGLPPGMMLDSSSGRIAGTPTTAGTYSVTAFVYDGVLSASQGFTWTVGGAAAGAATPLSPIGTIPTTTPAFSWGAATGAASYQLEVLNSSGHAVIVLTTTASAAGCGTGGTCRVSPGVALPAGTATWQVQTITSTGTTAWSPSVAFTVQPPDTIAPSIAITSPTTTSAYVTTSSFMTVAGTASDNIGVSSVTWSSDRGISSTATGTTSWSASVPLQVGTNTLVFSARDAAGNATAVILTVTYAMPDTTPPAIAVTSPTASPAYQGVSSATIAGTASDANGVSGVTWTSSTGLSGTAMGTTAWDAAVPLQIGTNTITVTARDAAGNAGSTTTSVVYTTPATLLGPSGTVTTPTPVFTWTASPLASAYTLQADDATQVGKIQMTISPTTAGCASGGTCSLAPGVTLSSGLVTWVVRTIVGTGSISSAPMTFTVRSDTQAPVVTITSPTSKSSFNTSATGVTIGGTAVDNSGSVAGVAWSTDQGASGVASGTSSWIANVPVGDGVTVVTITARDSFGNLGTSSLTIHRSHGKK